MQVSSEKRGGFWFALAVNEKEQLMACAVSDRSRSEAERAVTDVVASWDLQVAHGNSRDSRTIQKLYDIFMGRGGVALDLLDLSHVSSFRKKVYHLLRRIPRGRVTTYGAIAKKLSSRRYARAVGTAVATNPLPLVIPCHRVVPSTLSVGNYGMPGRKPSQGAYIKRKLLEREGVMFQGGKVSKESLWAPQ